MMRFEIEFIIILGLAVVIFILFIILMLVLITKSKLKKQLKNAKEDNEKLKQKNNDLFHTKNDEIEKLQNRCEVAERGRQEQKNLETIVFETLSILTKRL